MTTDSTEDIAQHFRLSTAPTALLLCNSPHSVRSQKNLKKAYENDFILDYYTQRWTMPILARGPG